MTTPTTAAPARPAARAGQTPAVVAAVLVGGLLAMIGVAITRLSHRPARR